MVANINLPRILRVGAGASKTLGVTLAELSLRRPLIITDSFMVQSGHSATLAEQRSENYVLQVASLEDWLRLMQPDAG